MDIIQQSITDANDEQLHGLLEEVVRTIDDLRYRVSPRYRFDQRWDDLIRCLFLDGYKVENRMGRKGDRLVFGCAIQ